MQDKKFHAVLNLLYPSEGGYNNKKNDYGGPTNLGVTQGTFNAWRKMNNRPTETVRNITRAEAEEIYYNMYWKDSGADKQSDIRDAYILFDTAVQYGAPNAKRMFKNANNNFYTMLEQRKSTYNQRVIDDPTQKEFHEGWLNRVKDIEKNANKLIKNETFKPSYSKNTTPFDDDYKGSLRNPEISDPIKKQSLKNKYQYLLHKNGNVADMDEIDTRTDSQKFSDQIRAEFQRMRSERNRRVLGRNHPSNYGKKNSSGSGKGRWVTINGAHVYMED